MIKKYVPMQGDIIYLDFNPIKGHKQSGHRPAVVISNNYFNEYTKMILVCPITTNNKYFPTHYLLEDTINIQGSVLCEHIRSINYEVRKVKLVERLNKNDYVSVITLVNACIETNLV